MIFKWISTFLTVLGPNLPFPISGSTMVTSPTEKGVVLIAGYNESECEHSNALIELSHDFKSGKFKWNILNQTLVYPRRQHLAFPITHQLCSYFQMHTR